MPEKINPDDLDIDIVSDGDDISVLDCTEQDGTDPLGVLGLNGTRYPGIVPSILTITLGHTLRF
ncbi:MAG: hypothetical protein ACYDAJ_08440 [Nitrosotalea sp.]